MAPPFAPSYLQIYVSEVGPCANFFATPLQMQHAPVMSVVDTRVQAEMH